MKQDRWEKDGQKQSRVSIVADNVQLLGGKSGGEQGAPKSEKAPSDTSEPENQMPPSEDFSKDFPEDIPF